MARGQILFFFSSRRRHTRYWRDGVQTCALPISGFVLLSSSTSTFPYISTKINPIRATGNFTVVVGIQYTVGYGNGINFAEIGRASCRERVEILVVAGSLRKKEEKK